MPRVHSQRFNESDKYLYHARYPMTHVYPKDHVHYGKLHREHKTQEIVVPQRIHECGHVCHGAHADYEGHRRHQSTDHRAAHHKWGCCRCRAVEDHFKVSLGYGYPRHGIEFDKLREEQKIKGYWAKSTRFRWGYVKRFGLLREQGQIPDSYLNNGLGLRSSYTDASSQLVLKNGLSSQVFNYPLKNPKDWGEAETHHAPWNPAFYSTTASPPTTRAENYRALVKVYQKQRDESGDGGGGYTFAIPPDEYETQRVDFHFASHLGWHKGLARYALYVPLGYRRGRPEFTRGFDMLGIITGMPTTEFSKMCIHCRNAIKGIPDYLFWYARGYHRYAAMIMDRVEKEVIKQSKVDFQLEDNSYLPDHERKFSTKRGNIMPFVGCADNQLLPDRLNKNITYDSYHDIHQQDIERWASIFREKGTG